MVNAELYKPIHPWTDGETLTDNVKFVYFFKSLKSSRLDENGYHLFGGDGLMNKFRKAFKQKTFTTTSTSRGTCGLDWDGSLDIFPPHRKVPQALFLIYNGNKHTQWSMERAIDNVYNCSEVFNSYQK